MAFDTASPGQVQEILGVLKQRKWQIILPAAFVLTFGIVFAVIVPKKYEVRTRIELKESRNEADPQFRNPQQTPAIREIDNAEHHIRNYVRVQQVINSQGALWDNYINLNDAQRHDYIKKVIDNLRVDVKHRLKNTGSTFVDVTYTDVDGIRAERFLGVLTKKWIDDVVQRDLNRLTNERNILQNQVREADEKYRTLNRRYTDVAQSMGIDPAQPLSQNTERAQDPVYGEAERVKTQMNTVRRELSGLKAELAALEARLADVDEFYEVEVSEGGIDFDREVLTLEQQILKLEEGRANWTPRNSKWKLAQKRLEALEEEIDSLRALEQASTTKKVSKRNEAYDALVAEIAVKRVDVEGSSGELESLNKSYVELVAQANKRAEDYRDLRDLVVERNNAEQDWNQKYAELHRKQSALEIAQRASGDPYEYAELPKAGEKPTEPNPIVIVLFTAVAGLALGLTIAVASEYVGNAYRSPYELAQVMSVPVLGAINTIITTAEARKRQARRTFVGFSTVVIIGGFVWFTWVWAYNPELLPVELRQAIEGLRLQLM